MDWAAARLRAAGAAGADDTDGTDGTDGTDDSGMTLIEVVVAMAIVTTALLGLLGELAAAAHAHAHARTQAAAERMATTSMDAARLQSYGTLQLLAGLAPIPAAAQVFDGTPFTPTQTFTRCSASDAPGTCTTPLPGAPDSLRITVAVSWPEGGTTHSVQEQTSVTDDRVQLVEANGTGTIASLLGGTASVGTLVTVSAFTVAPTSIGAGADGHPIGSVTLTLTAVGVPTTSWFPASWSDDAGSHQVTMMPSGAGTWSATIASTQLTRAVPTGQGSAAVVFAATVPGTRAIPTATLTLLPAPSFVGSCAVTASPILLKPLTTQTAGPEVLSCTTAGMTAAGDVSATFPTTAGTMLAHLTSTDGTSWRTTLTAGIALKGPLTEAFTFTPKRVDGMLGNPQTVTAAML